MVIFDVLGIDLVHGWIVDPQDKDIFELISPLSYNQCMEKLIAMNVILEGDEKSREKPTSASTAKESSPETLVETKPSQESKEEQEDREQREEIDNNNKLKTSSSSTSSTGSISTPNSAKQSPKMSAHLRKVPTPNKGVATIRREDIKEEDIEKILREGIIPPLWFNFARNCHREVLD